MKIKQLYPIQFFGVLLFTFRFLCVLLLVINSIKTDESAIKKINKHQKWLKLRYKEKSNILSDAILSTPFELSNLWRFQYQKPRKLMYMDNEIYPRNTEHADIFAPKSTINTIGTTSAQTSVNEYNLNSHIFHQENEKLSAIRLSQALQSFLDTSSISKNQHTKTFVKNDSSKNLHKSLMRSKPQWSNWSNWSNCSRSCGLGIKYQTRQCNERRVVAGKHYTNSNCIGFFKRYQTCNDHPCPISIKDFRSSQCAAFNNYNFQGQSYVWEPYIKDNSECKLTCKPLKLDVFATLNESVIDGTPCRRPAEYYQGNFTGRAVCIDGICKAIQIDGFIAGPYANRGYLGCGSLLCRSIKKTYMENPRIGKITQVALIPAGASNISITELRNSKNLLVLRTSDQKYILNGANIISESGDYKALDTIFDYHRIDGLKDSEAVTEWITCTGPISDTLELMVVSKEFNPGIKYEYLLPVTSNSEENELLEESYKFMKQGVLENPLKSFQMAQGRKYFWKVVKYSTCSKSCGGGLQTPLIRCMRANSVRYYSKRRCMHLEKPQINKHLLQCNTQPCPSYWYFDDWGECECIENNGHQKRTLSCVQEQASIEIVKVDDRTCIGKQPVSQRPCECPKLQSYPDSSYNNHLKNKTLPSYYANEKKSSSVWLTSAWNHYCSSECGSGVEYRTIFCDRSKKHSDRCDPQATPSTTRPCKSNHICHMGDWFSGPWTACNGNCFNLSRSRQVLCIQNQLIIENERCNLEMKPLDVEECSLDAAEYCAPRWHYSDWTECTKLCDVGTQRRHVKCLEYNENKSSMIESKGCSFASREPIYRKCNTHKCQEK